MLQWRMAASATLMMGLSLKFGALLVRALVTDPS
jgi:hypothetical protein